MLSCPSAASYGGGKTQTRGVSTKGEATRRFSVVATAARSNARNVGLTVDQGWLLSTRLLDELGLLQPHQEHLMMRGGQQEERRGERTQSRTQRRAHARNESLLRPRVQMQTPARCFEQTRLSAVRGASTRNDLNGYKFFGTRAGVQTAAAGQRGCGYYSARLIPCQPPGETARLAAEATLKVTTKELSVPRT